jgi:malate dehydrogenase
VTMHVAIVGAAGSCGRQLAGQLLDRGLLSSTSRLQLVGHRGGHSEHELWGLRVDLEDAFVDDAPTLEVVLDPDRIDADVVVMLAGATVSTDPLAPVDRAALGRINRAIFVECADAIAARRDRAPIVIVQSNPVELGVQVFAERLGRHRVVGAGAWSDTLRLRAELAEDFGVRRPVVRAPMLGQHGDHAVPCWSQVGIRGIAEEAVRARVAELRAGRELADFPAEIAAHKLAMLELVRAGRVEEAFARVQALPPDLRATVKPFFTHFTAGRTTEMATAHAVADLVACLAHGEERVFPAQVMLDGEWLDLEGPIAVPVLLSVDGWTSVHPLALADDEVVSLRAAADAVRAAHAAFG